MKKKNGYFHYTIRNVFKDIKYVKKIKEYSEVEINYQKQFKELQV